MKKLLLPFFISLSICSYAQQTFINDRVTDHSTHINKDNIDAIVFDSSYVQNANDILEIKIKRYTPTIDDILLAEKVLKAQLTQNEKLTNYKYILNHLGEARRQYIGYFDENGNKMIYINSFPNDLDWAEKKIKIENSKNIVPTWYNSIFIVFDGGASFWQAHINLSKKKLKGLSFNGEA